ncbi:MAG: aldo/keto reductase family protein [Spirochaetota bacterium]
MKYRKLGNTGLFVSEIGYGSWLTFANQIDLDRAEGILRAALELGVNYIDTADVYAKGTAEELLGRVLPGSFRRQEYVLATKVYFPMSDAVNDRGLSRKHIFDSINDSLRRLRQEYVDIYYCHRYDENTPLVETIQAMQDLIHAGKIMHWGVSQWTADQIAEASSKCKANGWTPPAVNQPIYSLLNRGIEERILPICDKHNLGVAVFSPLAQGILTGKYSGGTVPEGSRGSIESLNMFMREHLSDDDVLARVDRLSELASEHHLSTAQLALAVLLQRRDIDTLIVGAVSVDQIEENVRASGVTLSEEVLEEIDGLFPGPKTPRPSQ